MSTPGVTPYTSPVSNTKTRPFLEVQVPPGSVALRTVIEPLQKLSVPLTVVVGHESITSGID